MVQESSREKEISRHEKHYLYAPGGNKTEKAIFSFKVTRSLTLMSFERASFVEYARHI